MQREFDPSRSRRSLIDALVEAAQTYGAKKPILEDQERNPLSYTDLIRATCALGRKLAKPTTRGERVGVLLPTSSAAVARRHPRRRRPHPARIAHAPPVTHRNASFQARPASIASSDNKIRPPNVVLDACSVNSTHREAGAA